MGNISCRITRWHCVSGMDQQGDCLRVSILSSQNTTARELGEDITQSSSLNNIDMAAAVEAIKTYLSAYLSTGQIVHIDGLGSFQLAIGLKENARPDAKVTARNVEVRGVTFRPSESFVRKLRDDVHFVIKEDRRDTVSVADSIGLLCSYMAQCRAEGRAEAINVKRFGPLASCSESTARSRLKALVADGFLVPSPDFRGYFIPGPRMEMGHDEMMSD